MKLNILLWASLFFLLVSCVNQIDDLQFVPLTPEIALPVGTFRIKADNLTKIGDSLLVQEGDQEVIELYYETEVLRAALFDRLSIPNQSFNETLPFSSFIFSGGVDSQVKVSEYNSFTIQNIDLVSPSPDLEQVIFKAGTLNISQSKNFDHQLETTITFPTFIKNGNPIVIILNNNNSFSTSLNLADLDLMGVAGTKVNTIDYEISSVVTNTGSDTQGSIFIGFSMDNMEFSYMKGDFKTYLFDEIANTFETGLPQSEFPDNIAFTNPSVDIGILNSAGIPFGLDIVELSVTQEGGTVVPITGTYDDETFLIVSPTVPGEVAQSNFIIDKNNTDNFVEVLNEIPQSVFFNGLITANNFGTPTGGNFVTDSSEIVVNSKFVLPFEGYANEYALTDTLDANLNIDGDSIISLGNLNLRLQAENSFPMDVAIQMYFLDSLDNSIILDSLFDSKEDQQLFPAGEVDNSGLVIAPTFQSNDIIIDNEKYERIRYAGTVRLVASISTPGVTDSPPKSVRITKNDYFLLGIGFLAQALVDPNAVTN